MQVSSYDRPSAIAHITSNVGCPNERILGTAGYFPPDYTKWYQKLQIILGSACKALNPGGTGAVQPEDAYNRPLSPTAAILRELDRWKDGLPAHLRVEAANSLAPAVQRPLLLMYIEYYYILVLITRSALLRRAMMITAESPNDQPIPQALITVSETCIDAGKSLGQLLRRMDSIHRYNAVTWFDVFYTVMATSISSFERSLTLSTGGFCLGPRA
jgi:hypothetical protein